jgi:hypothetical protein
MNPILEAAVEVEFIVRAARFPFCFIGGIAVQRWGTQDDCRHRPHRDQQAPRNE